MDKRAPDHTRTLTHTHAYTHTRRDPISQAQDQETTRPSTAHSDSDMVRSANANLYGDGTDREKREKYTFPLTAKMK